MASRIYPMGLIFSSILILVLPGVMFNNFSASGLSPAFSLSCGSYPDVTCQNGNVTGCQAVPGACTLQGSTISFLNQQSPWTDVLTGDVSGFISALTTRGQLPRETTFQVGAFGNQGIFPAACNAYYQGNMTADSYYVIRNCTAVNVNGTALPKSQTPVIQAGPNFPNQTAIHFYNLGVTNSTEWPETASAYLQSDACNLLFSFVLPNQSETAEMDGCQFYATHSDVTTYWYYTVSVNFTGGWTSNTYGGTRTFAYCGAHFGLNQTQCPPPTGVPFIVQPEQWNVYDCGPQGGHSGGASYHTDLGFGGSHFYDPLAFGPITPQCSAMLTSIDQYNAKNSGQSSSWIGGSILLWVGSLIIFVVASGINFSFTGSIFATGGGAGIGSNRQATKFAQVLGLGLIVYIPLFSEFSTWFTSGILPNGFDGFTGITSILITAMIFGGIFWQATQD
jgi:hypothetical protein